MIINVPVEIDLDEVLSGLRTDVADYLELEAHDVPVATVLKALGGKKQVAQEFLDHFGDGVHELVQEEMHNVFDVEALGDAVADMPKIRTLLKAQEATAREREIDRLKLMAKRLGMKVVEE